MTFSSFLLTPLLSTSYKNPRNSYTEHALRSGYKKVKKMEGANVTTPLKSDNENNRTDSELLQSKKEEGIMEMDVNHAKCDVQNTLAENSHEKDVWMTPETLTKMMNTNNSNGPETTVDEIIKVIDDFLDNMNNDCLPLLENARQQTIAEVRQQTVAEVDMEIGIMMNEIHSGKYGGEQLKKLEEGIRNRILFIQNDKENAQPAEKMEECDIEIGYAQPVEIMDVQHVEESDVGIMNGQPMEMMEECDADIADAQPVEVMDVQPTEIMEDSAVKTVEYDVDEDESSIIINIEAEDVSVIIIL